VRLHEVSDTAAVAEKQQLMKLAELLQQVTQRMCSRWLVVFVRLPKFTDAV
jgi:hypothetical protein